MNLAINKSIEIDNKNLNFIKLRAFANYRLKNFKKAKEDFESLIIANIFLSEVYYYLGNIVIKQYLREDAIVFWKKALEQGNKKAQDQLDLYDTFTGKYLLHNSQVIKKLTSNQNILILYSKYIGGLAEIDNSEKLSKLKTEIMGYENGVEIEIRKTFKMYHIAIAFYELDDIAYNKLENILEFHLVDKSILKFKYNLPENNFFQGLYKLCIKFKEKSGKIPTAFPNLKNVNDL